MVGYTLRQERERQNLSINDIEEGTSIRSVYIEAIENGEYDKLPGAVYTKGFIKNYAKFLGLDAEAMTKEFAADLAELKGHSEEPAAKEPEPVKAEKKPVSYPAEGRSVPNKLIIAAVVLIALLAGAIWSWLSNGEGEVANVTPPPHVQQASTPTEYPDPVDSTPPAKSVSVQARFNDRCWLLVTVDGAVVQEGVVEGGQTLTWEGKDQINFRLGNAGAVEFFQDGKSLGVLGAVGDVVDKTFSRQ